MGYAGKEIGEIVMKIKMVALAFAMCICVMLSGCQYDYEDYPEVKETMFVPVEVTKYWIVVYQKDTKVMYTVSNATSNIGTFSLLVNSDGTPMIYEGE